MTPEEKIQKLTDALKQMLGAFDSPVARRRMNDEWSEASRKYAADIYREITGRSHYEG